MHARTMRTITANVVTIYLIFVAIIFNQNACNGFTIASLLLRQQKIYGLLSLNAIDDDTDTRVNGDVNVNDNANGNAVSSTSDLCLLIDDENDCFHDIEMDYDGATAVDYEERWWNSLSDEQKQGTIVVDSFIKFIPFVIPVIGYFTYEPVAAIFNFLVDFLSTNNWVSVDGRQLQTQVLTPAVNGIAVPTVSLLFANLVSVTIQTLRQRQLNVLTALNVEANELRFLHSLISAFPINDNDDIKNYKAKDAQYRCLAYLAQYITRLIAESKPGAHNTILQYGSTESEMNGLQEQLNIIDIIADMPSANLLSQSYDSVGRILIKRSERLSALQSTFPPLHFAILTASAGSVLTAFLMECNQEVLYFLSAVELRMLWTILVGTYASLAVVLYDLSDPFRGSYHIRRSTDQLYSLRASFQTLCENYQAVKKSRKKMKNKNKRTKSKL